MRRFIDLYMALDSTTKTTLKINAMADYFEQAPAEDAAWAIYFLTGRKLRRLLPAKKMRMWAGEICNIPEWLTEECYHAVGDAAETAALLLPEAEQPTAQSLSWWVAHRLEPLRDMEEEDQKALLIGSWKSLDTNGKLVWNKIISGNFRVGVSQQLVLRALSAVANLPKDILAYRLMGQWEPTADFYRQLVSLEPDEASSSRPYPFYLAHPLEQKPGELGPIEEWQAEWKWDGIRAQVICRGGEVLIWTRGEELVTDRYPEIKETAQGLPDGTVLDGEILPWKNNEVLDFGLLQKRIGRKTVGRALLKEIPVMLMAYDLLEVGGKDLRETPLHQRREKLEQVLSSSLVTDLLMLSPKISAGSWEELTALWEGSRSRKAEGMMLKRKSSQYEVGRKRGNWWKWKVEPYTMDAVLLSARRGSGKRAGLYTDYTFGAWRDGALIPVAKAYSGLTDKEIQKVDAFIRRSTVDKFGPVRTVTPELVFEIAFEGIQRSTRHKSGLAVRFPRILRWRTDKQAADADDLATIEALLESGEIRRDAIRSTSSPVAGEGNSED